MQLGKSHNGCILKLPLYDIIILHEREPEKAVEI